MARIIELPKLSPTMEEGTLVRWAKREGDAINVDDPTDRLFAWWRLDSPRAEAASLGKSYLCELEAGHHSPTLEVQLRLETAFGLVRGGLLRLAHYAMRRLA